LESKLHSIVAESPSDPEARQSLALCLLLLAMYTCGAEHQEPDAADGQRTTSPCATSTKGDKRNSSDLMREHIKHMHVLKLISPTDHEEPWRLHSLRLGQLFAVEPDASIERWMILNSLAKVVRALRNDGSDDNL